MQTAVDDALAAWNKAPAHVRMMAGAYVSPLLIALAAIANEVEALKEEVKNGKS